jgi:hypothetical protein
MCVSCNFTITVEAQDYIEIMWESSSVNTTMSVIADTSVKPENPSASVNINQINF